MPESHDDKTRHIRKRLVDGNVFALLGWVIACAIEIFGILIGVVPAQLYEPIVDFLIAFVLCSSWLIVISRQRYFTTRFCVIHIWSHYVIWFCVWIHQIVFNNEMRYISLFTAVISLGFVFAGGSFRFAVAISLNTVFIYLVTSVICIEYFGQNGSVLTEIFNVAGYSLILFFIVILSRLFIKQRLELKMYRMKLEENLLQLKDADAQKTRFFQNISHELRTPLTLIMGPIDEACRIYDDERLKMVSRNSKRLYRLVNQLLDFQKMSFGKNELSLVPLNIVPVLNTIAKVFEGSCLQRNIRFVWSNRAKQAIHISANVDAFEKIVFNYLSNALKFAPEHGKIELILDDLGETVRIGVSDTGAGIAEHEQHRLFSLFSQLENSISCEHEGTGIGLALVKELTEKMNGKVGLESKVGAGSVFYVEFPFVKENVDMVGGSGTHNSECIDSDDGPRDLKYEPKNWHLYCAECVKPRERRCVDLESGDGELILVVDDVADMRDMVSGILKKNGFRVVVAADGAEGYRVAKEVCPDLIVTDWMMPVASGPDLISKLQEDGSLSTIPTIMLTARTDDESRIFGEQTGVSAYLGKPFYTVELLSVVNNLLRLKTKEREYQELWKVADHRLAEIVAANEVIEERNQKLTAIFEVIDQGICLIRSDRTLAREHSRALGRFIDISAIESNADAISTLFENTTLDENAQNVVRAVLVACIGSDAFAFQVNRTHLPRAVVKNVESGHIDLEVDWMPIIDTSNTITEMVIILRDVTDLLKLRAEFMNSTLKENAIRELLTMNLYDFRIVEESAERILFSIDEFLAAKSMTGMKDIKCYLHALKGNSRALGLAKLAGVIHKVEDSLCALEHQDTGDQHALIEESLSQFRGILIAYCSACGVFLKQRQAMLSDFRETLTFLSQSLSNSSNFFAQENIENLRLIAADPAAKRLESIFHSVEDNVRREAVNMGHPMPEFRVTCERGVFVRTGAIPWLTSLINQLVSNTFAHGLTLSSKGFISLKVNRTRDGCVIEYFSSEEGMDLNKLAFKAEEGDWNDRTDHGLMEMLFASEISTAPAISELAGRGVGLNTARTLARNAGGELTVEFVGTPNENGRRPFVFKIALPGKDLIDFCRLAH